MTRNGTRIRPENNLERRHSFGGRTPSGLRHSWRLWRLCCCRYGWYPLFVAPIVTAGCLLSLYSAAGCDFIRVDVGFTPSNTGWNSSTLEIGLFLYQSGEEDTNKYYAAFFEGCRQYTDEFTEEFVQNDRTWRVAQIMAYVSAGGGIVATVFTWLFVVSPLPARFFWPVVVLPALVAAFLAEASKLLFFDTAICRKNVWFPPGTESLPQQAGCSFGATAIYGIASGIIFLVCLILVCLKAPNRRDLEPNYGLDVENGIAQIPTTNSYYGSKRSDRFTKSSSFGSDSHRDPYLYHHAKPMIGGPVYDTNGDGAGPGVPQVHSRGYNSSYAVRTDIQDDDDQLLSQLRSRSIDQTAEGEVDDISTVSKPPTMDVTVVRKSNAGHGGTISRSRLETVERMEKNASVTSENSAKIIDQLLVELDQSFNDERQAQ